MSVREFTVDSKSREELIDITSQVAAQAAASGVDSGVCVAYTPHTTAAVTVEFKNEIRPTKSTRKTNSKNSWTTTTSNSMGIRVHEHFSVRCTTTKYTNSPSEAGTRNLKKFNLRC